MSNMNKVKSEQLGMSHSTAQGRLRKSIMFMLIEKADMNKCHRCGKPMTVENFSIEHIENWLHSENPIELFFGLDNITFSHHSCNVSAGRRPEVEPLSLIDRKGENAHSSKLKEEDVIVIRELLASGESQRSIAKKYNVHHSLIGQIKNRKIWNHI